MQKITTFLWFDGQADDAMNHYLAIFPGSRIVNVGAMETLAQARQDPP